INEFLQEYEFERVDFVYEPGQYAIRGGIVDIFSFSNYLPYRIEFFGNEIDSIRTFDVESQLSVSEIHTVTIVPNVQAKFLTEGNISLLEYIAADSAIWFEDVQVTLDIVARGYKKAGELWKALPEADKHQNPEWVNPLFNFVHEKNLSAMLADCAVVEFGKQFFYQATETIVFEQRPQPSFNKDFS